MKIDSASYSLASSHLAVRRDEQRESLRMWIGDRRPDFEARSGVATAGVSLSSAARRALATDFQAAAAMANQGAAAGSALDEAADAAVDDPFLSLIISMIEMMTGQKVRIFSTRDLPQHSVPTPVAPAAGTARRAAPPQPAGFGIEYDFHAVHEEHEQTRVSATGIVRTADGREIRIALDLSMTRDQREETTRSVRVGDALRKDPLVLNFNGNAAQLTDLRFAFDLDSDGRAENVAMLAAGSGYLAIDRNDNGRIDSGRELFGPVTDSGFGELALLDGDGNGWIDENDRAFASLRIWTPDANGAGTLETLARREVGAIAVGHIASPFELRGAGNDDLGGIAATGLFLGEDGRVGSVQEIDLTV